jgi:glycosyltransferase involved in cell wall biosynthesis
MKLLVVSHTPHYMRDDRVVGWGPTVREIDEMTRCFDEVAHLAPLHPEAAPASALPYERDVSFLAVEPAGGSTASSKMGVALQVPRYARKILSAARSADVIHIRTPANISLVALLLTSLTRRPRYRWVKYAGNWRPPQRTALSYSLQRWWTGRGLHGGATTVNGRWPDQRSHVYTFLNPCLTLDELSEGRAAGEATEFSLPLRILFVGRVERMKGMERVLEIATELVAKGIDVGIDIAGDGPERAEYERRFAAAGLAGRVVFHGWVARPDLSRLYGGAHVLLLPSGSEGWPKVVSEAMAYGAVPVVGAVSGIPDFLEETGAGAAVPPLDVAGYVAAIAGFAEDPAAWGRARDAGLAAAPRFTYDAYLEDVRRMFASSWGIHLSCGSKNADT